MRQTHDHDHDPHAAIQASDQVSEFEILEKAVRELAIEKGLFSEEDHRRFSEWAESIGPSRRVEARRQGMDRPGFQGAAAGRRYRGLQGGGHRLARPHRHRNT